ncbi:MAG TPA: tetratricopeptide repeat protein, partial [Planctomycetota bacterium]|nr:tetratricopeptide repeat protein [Planctomycetota bacterium]
LAASPTKTEAIRGLALCEMRLQNPARAIVLLRKVLELRPDHADAHAWLAQVLFDEGDTEKALVHAERARDLEPWEPRPWFLLSRMYAELDRPADSEAARERFETNSRVAQQVLQQEGLLLHDPSRADVWRELIALRRASENRPAVRDALPRLVALKPLAPRLALTVVDAYEWLGDLERAKRAAHDAEATAGEEKAAWSWLADFYQRAGDKDSAERAKRAAAAGR